MKLAALIVSPSAEVSIGTPGACGPPVQTAEGAFFKSCIECEKLLPFSAFGRIKSAPDGLTYRCKNCRNRRAKFWRAAHSDQARAATLTWRASNPDKVRNQRLGWRAKNPNRVKAYGRVFYRKHKEALLAASREWHKAHPDAVKANLARWNALNPEKKKANSYAWRKANKHLVFATAARRRALKRGASGYSYTTAQHVKWRWEMWGGRCWMCGDKATTTDHVIALACGGSHWPANLRPACKSCNSRKGAKPLSELRLDKAGCI